MPARATLISLVIIAAPGLILASPWVYYHPPRPTGGGWSPFPILEWDGAVGLVIVPVSQLGACIMLRIALSIGAGLSAARSS